MFTYEGGVAVAFLFWLFSVINLLITINSKFERNLNQMGLRTSWLTQTPKELTSEDMKRSAISKIFRFFIINGIGLATVLMSWLYVALVVIKIVYIKSKDSGAPAIIKEYRWRMKNLEMSFDQIVKELMKISDQDPANFEEFREELRSELSKRIQ